MKSLVFALTLAVASPFVLAEGGVVFQSSFELPVVGGRTPKAQGGDITQQGEKPEWSVFGDSPVAGKPSHTGTAANEVLAGVTNEMARTGDQSLFVQANQLTTPYAGVVFSSVPFRIVPGQEYLVCIWGRNDAIHPLSVAAAQLYLKLQINYYSDAGATQVGTSDYLVEPLPGTPGRAPIFITSKWQQVRRRVTTPEDAKYMTVTWRCESSPGESAINGVMYFDDVNVEGKVPSKADDDAAAAKAKETPVTSPEATPAPATETTPAPAAEATPTPEPAASATPSPTAKPTASATPKHRKRKPSAQ